MAYDIYTYIIMVFTKAYTYANYYLPGRKMWFQKVCNFLTQTVRCKFIQSRKPFSIAVFVHPFFNLVLCWIYNRSKKAVTIARNCFHNNFIVFQIFIQQFVSDYNIFFATL